MLELPQSTATKYKPTVIVKSAKSTLISPPPLPPAVNFKSAKNSGKDRRHTALIELRPSLSSLVSFRNPEIMIRRDIMLSHRDCSTDKDECVDNARKVCL